MLVELLASIRNRYQKWIDKQTPEKFYRITGLPSKITEPKMEEIEYGKYVCEITFMNENLEPNFMFTTWVGKLPSFIKYNGMVPGLPEGREQVRITIRKNDK